MVYLDNAATSYPKAPGVASAMADYVEKVGATINRSSYASAQEAGLVTLSLRERLCRLFNHPDPTHAVLTPGATAGLNMVIKGLLRPGDHCLVSSMEHNAVMRPLVQLEREGVAFERIPCDAQGRLRLEALPGMIKLNTRLVVMAHGSNVCGTVQDAEAVGKICRERGVPFALDAAQTAGHIEVDFERFGLAALVVPGHKGLLGPQGIGALLLDADFARRLTPLVAGGTGSASDSEELPGWMPDRFESGTPNMPGVYGWEAALGWLENTGIETLENHEKTLSKRFLEGIYGLKNVKLYGITVPERRTGVFSVGFLNCDNAEAAWRLEREFGILTRCGLHCAPSAHKTLGSFPEGSVRFSTGWANTEADIDAALSAIAAI
ncbi:MAG TPA: aminotransferase class V-fold PLP-dependent enzyme [Candidatus Scatomorpha intestinigallinarum]|uniref:cysteine desulfurase n=1 Tax=Candidatus Scatomorpha intestinigallinarum TaxID=2840923 RepID=A0A9D1DKD1_9FIRM|nr:aminotransferase class V-fold PLP-dependent enzyme [Candidatus Scatomorpha intestinigallinarum]